MQPYLAGGDGRAAGPISWAARSPCRDGVLLARLRVSCSIPRSSSATSRSCRGIPCAGPVFRRPQPACQIWFRLRSIHASAAHERSADIPAQSVAAAARGYWKTVFARLARDKVSSHASCCCSPWCSWPFCAPDRTLRSVQGSILKRRLLRSVRPATSWAPTSSGRDMLHAPHLRRPRLSLVMGLAPVINAFVHRRLPRHHARPSWAGRVNTAMMRTVDVFYAFPSVLLAVAISVRLGAGILGRSVSPHDRFHPADRARVAESVTTQVRSARFRRIGAGGSAPRRPPSFACVSWATSSARSSSARPGLISVSA